MLMRTPAMLVAFTLMACGGDDNNNADGGPDGSVTDAPSNNDVVTPTDSGGDVHPGSDASNDASNDGGGMNTTTCGTTSCPLPAESCCVTPGGTPSYACTGGDAGTCQQGDVQMQCMSNNDCPSSKVCCLDATNDPASAACATTCNGQNQAVLCDPKLTAAQNRCGDAGACGTTNDNTWNLSSKVSGTCGDQQGPF